MPGAFGESAAAIDRARVDMRDTAAELAEAEGHPS